MDMLDRRTRLFPTDPRLCTEQDGVFCHTNVQQRGRQCKYHRPPAPCQNISPCSFWRGVKGQARGFLEGFGQAREMFGAAPAENSPHSAQKTPSVDLQLTKTSTCCRLPPFLDCYWTLTFWLKSRWFPLTPPKVKKQNICRGVIAAAKFFSHPLRSAKRLSRLSRPSARWSRAGTCGC